MAHAAAGIERERQRGGYRRGHKLGCASTVAAMAEDVPYTVYGQVRRQDERLPNRCQDSLVVVLRLAWRAGLLPSYDAVERQRDRVRRIGEAATTSGRQLGTYLRRDSCCPAGSLAG